MADPNFPYALDVDPTITARCRELFPKLAVSIGVEKVDAVLRELYLDEFFYYDEMGQLKVELTDLQLVAITYALGAFIKAGAVWDGSRGWAGRYAADSRLM